MNNIRLICRMLLGKMRRILRLQYLFFLISVIYIDGRPSLSDPWARWLNFWAENANTISLVSTRKSQGNSFWKIFICYKKIGELLLVSRSHPTLHKMYRLVTLSCGFDLQLQLSFWQNCSISWFGWEMLLLSSFFQMTNYVSLQLPQFFASFFMKLQWFKTSTSHTSDISFVFICLVLWM